MPPPAGKVEELSSCLPGDKILVWYSDDTVYHERILLWKVNASTWYILTPDFDVYPEDLEDSANGPERFHIRGIHFKYPSRLAQGVYKFKNDLTEDELKRYMEPALDELGLRTVPDDQWKPDYVRVGNQRLSATRLLGRRLVPTVVRGKGGIDGLASEYAPEVAALLSPIEPAPLGHVWAGFSVPGDKESVTEVVVRRGQGVRTGTDELVMHHSRWIHVHLMSESDFNAAISKLTPARGSGDLER